MVGGETEVCNRDQFIDRWTRNRGDHGDGDRIGISSSRERSIADPQHLHAHWQRDAGILNSFVATCHRGGAGAQANGRSDDGDIHRGEGGRQYRAARESAGKHSGTGDGVVKRVDPDDIVARSIISDAHLRDNGGCALHDARGHRAEHRGVPCGHLEICQHRHVVGGGKEVCGKRIGARRLAGKVRICPGIDS